jgi:hypothetical protein
MDVSLIFTNGYKAVFMEDANDEERIIYAMFIHCNL